MCARAGQEEGVPEVAVPELRLATNSFTADQYPGWTHVSSANAKEPHFNNRELEKKRHALCVPALNSMYVFPPSVSTRGGTLASSSTSSAAFPRAAAFAFSPVDTAALVEETVEEAGFSSSRARPRLRMIAQSSSICERGTTSSRAPPSISTRMFGGSFGA